MTERVVWGKLPFKISGQERPRRESDARELATELAKEVPGGRAAPQRAQQGDSCKVATCLARCRNSKGLPWLTCSERGPHEKRPERVRGAVGTDLSPSVGASSYKGQFKCQSVELT